ncbi:oligosaccharide flippase family protein [Natronorarus salvus]|uniref:oligosaccharide flippase family protein n=1 Tax=Natronorarus salvus TaxID=3117733 RepID=UPI002F26087D
MTLASKISTDILTTAIFKASMKVRGLVFIPLLTISLGVSDYGAFVQVNAIATLVALVCLLGYDTGYVRYIHETDEEGRLFGSLLASTLTVATAGGALVVVMSELLARYTLQTTAYTTLFAIGGAYVIVHSLFQLSRSHYQATQRVKTFSLIEAMDVYLSVGAVAVTVLVLGGGVELAFGTFVGIHLLMTLSMVGDITHRGGIGVPTSAHVVDCTRFSLGAMGNTVSGSLLYKTDRVLIGFFLGASAVGIYSVAYSVGQLIKLFYQPISISFFPEFSQLWTRGDQDRIREYLLRGIRYALLIGIPSIAGFALVGEEVMALLSTDEIAEAGSLPLILIASALLIRGIGLFYSKMFYAKGTSRIPALIQFGAAVVNVPLNVVLIPIVGIIGAALATLISFSGVALLTASLWQYEFRVVPQWSEIGLMVFAAAVMLVVFILLPLPWPVVVLTAPPVYFGVFVALGGLTGEEQRLIKQVVR